MKRIIVSTIGVTALFLTACGGSEGGRSISGQQSRSTAVESRGNVANPPPAAPSNSNNKASSAVDAMNGAIGSDWSQLQREQMQSDAAEADKNRAAKSSEADKDRKHEAEMQNARLADRKEGRFMTTLKELMQMQMLGGMIHPDKCVNKGFISGLKSTAQALRDAMEPATKAAAVTPAPASGSVTPAILPAPTETPAQAAPASATPAAQPSAQPAPAPAAPTEGTPAGGNTPPPSTGTGTTAGGTPNQQLEAAAKKFAPVIIEDITQ